jgi:hypothetical protein
MKCSQKKKQLAKQRHIKKRESFWLSTVHGFFLATAYAAKMMATTDSPIGATMYTSETSPAGPVSPCSP